MKIRGRRTSALFQETKTVTRLIRTAYTVSIDLVESESYTLSSCYETLQVTSIITDQNSSRGLHPDLQLRFDTKLYTCLRTAPLRSLLELWTTSTYSGKSCLKVPPGSCHALSKPLLLRRRSPSRHGSFHRAVGQTESCDRHQERAGGLA